MAKKTVETTRRGKEQEAKPQVGIGGEIYVATLSWPSLGITPDAPEYGLRTASGPLAFSRSRGALVEWAERNYVHIHVDNERIEEED